MGGGVVGETVKGSQSACRDNISITAVQDMAEAHDTLDLADQCSLEAKSSLQPVLKIKFYWNTAVLFHLHIACGCSCAVMAEGVQGLEGEHSRKYLLSGPF